MEPLRFTLCNTSKPGPESKSHMIYIKLNMGRGLFWIENAKRSAAIWECVKLHSIQFGSINSYMAKSSSKSQIIHFSTQPAQSLIVARLTKQLSYHNTILIVIVITKHRWYTARQSYDTSRLIIDLQWQNHFFRNYLIIHSLHYEVLQWY